MGRVNLKAWMAQEEGKYFCACGCGEAITIQRHHHARGVPSFINGHCSRVRNPMAGRSGALNPNFRGGRYICSQGYVCVLVPKPERRGRSKYVHEHRLIMERYLGRRLLTSEHVHHRNGDKTDNRLVNLELLSPEAHSALHQVELRRRLGDEEYLAVKRRIHRGQPYRHLIG